ncbi:petrobactin ABC transporter substrate-binding protein YclQ [Bacillus spizizenii]|uniref:petrobactin ABC transporter substrate-binding protein YclQ n=1 Tax=Bacillus spizizenii TaxID=96241 RepID=UPI0005C9110D|nr:petrobactin ABC transporter substrate-binding protein YclQ [Bacillus spizizenii]MCY7794491.1 petrobactin ABC transporter substrate-binding protein YclQ [Bacillus spizizenii]MCY7803174.1 petrobactin ABC transporter substrate-binding protein YclQ [Bacillus spizizenii]MCY7873749.1 petrobactin ABC transporter substrate-binding protein YclQ [Bacillus spizizenii]MCY7876212.1 petrobactin ABC transporter substrate-binding protein YclQ [Bacillus spizizenii]MCY7898965.1 petrobactin ABC transporter su
MKKFALLFIALVTAVVISACGNQSTSSSKGSDSKNEQITVKHQLDKNGTKVPKNPKKVVVFDFGSLDTLDKLGLDAKVAGLPKQALPKYLSKFKDDKYADVGSLKEPDFEKVADLDPDLIIISGRQSESYKEFSEIAPTIYLGVDTAKYMESFKSDAETIGKIFDKEDEVKDELATIDHSIADLKKKAEKLNKNGLVIMANDGKISAFGSKSRYGLIHDVFGVTPADKNIKASTHGQSVSYEYISKTNPDYLFVIDRGTAIGETSSTKQVVENDYVKNVNAVKNDHVVYLDSATWYLSGGGLESMTQMIKEVKDGLEK